MLVNSNATIFPRLSICNSVPVEPSTFRVLSPEKLSASMVVLVVAASMTLSVSTSVIVTADIELLVPEELIVTVSVPLPPEIVSVTVKVEPEARFPMIVSLPAEPTTESTAVVRGSWEPEVASPAATALEIALSIPAIAASFDASVGAYRGQPGACRGRCGVAREPGDLGSRIQSCGEGDGGCYSIRHDIGISALCAVRELQRD